MAVVDEMISLFDAHREDFGFPEEACLDRQCEFEEKFDVLICEHRGHDIGPDHCGKPEHDLCYRCKRLRVDIE